MQDIRTRKRQAKEHGVQSRASSRASSRVPSRESSHVDLSSKFHQSLSSPELQALNRRGSRRRVPPSSGAEPASDDEGVRYVLITPEQLRRIAPRSPLPIGMVPERDVIEHPNGHVVPEEKTDGVHFDLDAKGKDGGQLTAKHLERGPDFDETSSSSDPDEEEEEEAFPNPWSRFVDSSFFTHISFLTTFPVFGTTSVNHLRSLWEP
jgi:hypothetical protein